MKKTLSVFMVLFLLLTSILPGALAVTGSPSSDPDGSIVEKIEVTSSKKLAMDIGDKYQPVNTASGIRSVTSSSTRVSISESGVITALAEGSAKVYVTLNTGKKYTLTITITDPKKCTGISLTLLPDHTAAKSTQTISIDGKLFLSPVLKPTTAETTITWTSSNTKVATVEDGIVRPVAAGSATITAKTANGKKASVRVKVVNPYLPKSVSVSEGKTATVNIGETISLTAVALYSVETVPEEYKTTFTWTSSRTKYATVENGTVTGVAEGTATITVKTANGKKATVKVTVKDPTKATGVQLTLSGETTVLKSYVLNVENTAGIDLAAIITPETAVKTLTWTTSNKKVATVDANGHVTAVAAGTATITAKAPSGKKATVSITVTAPSSLKVDAPTKTTAIGGYIVLAPTVVYKKTSNDGVTPTVTWETSDSAIATVTDGVVKGIAVGTASITAKTVNGKKVVIKITITE